MYARANGNCCLGSSGKLLNKCNKELTKCLKKDKLGKSQLRGIDCSFTSMK